MGGGDLALTSPAKPTPSVLASFFAGLSLLRGLRGAAPRVDAAVAPPPCPLRILSLDVGPVLLDGGGEAWLRSATVCWDPVKAPAEQGASLARCTALESLKLALQPCRQTALAARRLGLDLLPALSTLGPSLTCLHLGGTPDAAAVEVDLARLRLPRLRELLLNGKVSVAVCLVAADAPPCPQPPPTHLPRTT